MASKNNKSQESKPKVKQLVCCMNCKNAQLHRYDNNPILAACMCQPQPYDMRFPYAIEVARHMRYCGDWKESDIVKTVEQRTRRAA